MAPQLEYAYFGDIVKTEKTPEGLIVTGKAAGPDLDLDGQRCDPKWLKTAMPEWFKWANIREQHSTIAAGVGREMIEDGDDYHVKALIVDPGTIKKVENDVLKGFSVGIKNGRVVRDKSAPNGVINGGIIAEVSLVDRPCNPTATLSIAKSLDGATLVPVDEDGEAVEFEPQPAATPMLDKLLKSVGVDVPKIPTQRKPPAIESDAESDAGDEGDESEEEYDKSAQGDLLDVVLDDPAPVTRIRRVEQDMPASEYRKALRLVGDILDGTVINKALAADGTIDESADIEGAKRVVSLMADLIISEARELKNGRLAELRDIETLMQACRSMYTFITNEGYQHGTTPPGTSVDAEYDKAVTPDITKRDWSQAQRDDAESSGAAMPGGRYPITDRASLEDAIHAVGRGKGSHAEIRAHIISRARALGATDALPDDWNVSDKAATIDIQHEITKAVTAATAEVTAAYEERLATVQAQLTKVLATEVPGGPVIFSVQNPIQKTVVSENASKATQYRQMADRMTDPGVAAAYRELAAKVESSS